MKLSIEEAAYVLYSEHGMEERNGGRLTATTVAEWIKQGVIKSSRNDSYQVVDKFELEDFVEKMRWEGTAFEKGIDDQTKLDRLLEENVKLKKENEQLRKEMFKNAIECNIGENF